jgi:peptide/nickel transport system permease protein
MIRYTIKRALQALVLLFVIMIVTFGIFQVIGDPVRRILPINASEEQIETFRQANGFADPLIDRFGRFVSQVSRLEFGDSYTSGTPALQMVFDALGPTLRLTLAALILTVLVGVPLGAAAAVRRGSRFDRMLVAFNVVLVSLAEFWVGIMLIVIVSVKLGALPTSGYGLDGHLILPAITLALAPIGRLAFFTRSAVSDAIGEPHVNVARALGIPPRKVLRRHVVRNASAPIIAMAGSEMTRMLVAGSLVVETVFAWPGVGRLYATAMERYDLPLVTAALFVATSAVLVINFALDLIYARLDPRIRLQ